MLSSNHLVAGCSISPLKVVRACFLLLLAGFVRFPEYTASTSFCTHTVGQTGGWTVSQTHAKELMKRVKEDLSLLKTAEVNRHLPVSYSESKITLSFSFSCSLSLQPHSFCIHMYKHLNCYVCNRSILAIECSVITFYLSV